MMKTVDWPEKTYLFKTAYTQEEGNEIYDFVLNNCKTDFVALVEILVPHDTKPNYNIYGDEKFYLSDIKTLTELKCVVNTCLCTKEEYINVKELTMPKLPKEIPLANLEDMYDTSIFEKVMPYPAFKELWEKYACKILYDGIYVVQNAYGKYMIEYERDIRVKYAHLTCLVGKQQKKHSFIDIWIHDSEIRLYDYLIFCDDDEIDKLDINAFNVPRDMLVGNNARNFKVQNYK